jgi:uncharacterized protein
MEISYDDAKRALTLGRRGLDFEDAAFLFAGLEYTVADDRAEYGEERFQTYGLLGDRLVIVVWTPRGQARHIISMRKCNERERKKYARRLDRSG